MRSLLVAIMLVVTWASPGQAELSRERAARLGVDVVVLTAGREARGSIIEQRDDGGLSIAIRRAWLRERQAEWAAELDAAAQAEQRAALETLIERTGVWLAERADDGRLCAAIGIELERLERQRAGDATRPVDEHESEFMLVAIGADRIRRVYAQPNERKQLALVAWHEELDDVETTPVNRLQQELDDRQIDWRTTAVKLSDRLSSSTGDSEREWAARKAIYEYALRKPVDFQGVGDFVVRTGDGAAAPAGLELPGGLLQGELATDLANLVQDVLGAAAQPKSRNNWLETAAGVAEQEGARGFRVTRTEQDVPRRQASVEDRFVARMPDGTWETIWRTRETVDASQARPDLEARVRQDGQVAEALKLAEGLGLGSDVDIAVRFGAATMGAQQTAAARYFEFLDRFTLRLEGPVLKWTPDQN